MFQGEGTPSGTPLAPPPGFPTLPPGFSAPRAAPPLHAPHGSTPFAAPRKSARQAPQVQPPSGSAPQPSTSGWFPPDRPPMHTLHESTDSESEPSDSESVSAAADSTHTRFAALIHQVCPASRPLLDPKAPRCGFESWFGQPEPSSSARRFRMYPRVAEVQEEVAARAEALARRSRPVSRILPTRARFYALADDPLCGLSTSELRLRPAGWSAFFCWQALGSYNLLGNGAVRACLPGSAGGHLVHPLAHVRYPGHVEDGWVPAF